MQIYLPIAEVSVNVFLLFGLGGLVGVLSGMFGVGGGFLITPLLFFMGANQRAAGQYGAAIDSLLEQQRQLGGRRVPAPMLQLAAAYQQAGRGEEARGTMATLLQVAPHMNRDVAAKIHPYKRTDDETAYLDALAQAGLPQTTTDLPAAAD